MRFGKSIFPWGGERGSAPKTKTPVPFNQPRNERTAFDVCPSCNPINPCV